MAQPKKGDDPFLMIASSKNGSYPFVVNAVRGAADA